MLNRRGAAVAALALLIAACGNTSTGGPAAQRLTVFVDDKQPSGQPINLAALAYFPNELSAHPGDTIDFKVRWTGDPHTITFGSLVDADLKAFVPPQPGAPPAAPTAESKKLPNLVPIPPLNPGPPDINQAAAQPCFLASGEPPAGTACTPDQQKQPDFDGTQTFYNGGFLPQDAVFTMKIADGAKAGTFGFMCLLHREIMSGKLHIVDKSNTADGPIDVTKRGESQSSALIQTLQVATTAAEKAGPDGVSAGVVDRTGKVIGSLAAQFGPKDISIPVGGSVTWHVAGPHTITFGAATSDVGNVAKGSDGSFHLVGKAFGPAGGPGAPNAPPAGTSPLKPALIDGGTWNGQGLHSSGFILSVPDNAFFAYKLTFSTAGTYQYLCLIHPDMEGTVKVG